MEFSVINILSSIGLTYIITQSFLFEKIRNYPRNEFLKSLLNCPLCFGFWAYLIVELFDRIELRLLNYAFIASAASYLFYVTIENLSNGSK
jgi:hypothetical protein